MTETKLLRAHLATLLKRSEELRQQQREINAEIKALRAQIKAATVEKRHARQRAVEQGKQDRHQHYLAGEEQGFSANRAGQWYQEACWKRGEWEGL
jgi:septal ring factor EnvC (AmiA/AmiB activator)